MLNFFKKLFSEEEKLDDNYVRQLINELINNENDWEISKRGFGVLTNKKTGITISNRQDYDEYYYYPNRIWKKGNLYTEYYDLFANKSLLKQMDKLIYELSLKIDRETRRNSNIGIN